MKKFEVANVHCSKCADTIKNALTEEFGDISIELNQDRCLLGVEICDNDIKRFSDELEGLGFRVVKELS